MHEHEFWSRLAKRLAECFEQDLLAAVRDWTSIAVNAGSDAQALEQLDGLRDEVGAVGFLIGCLGAARGSDALRSRRESRVFELVVQALHAPLLREGSSVGAEGPFPELLAAHGGSESALLIAWSLWRASPERGVIEIRSSTHGDVFEWRLGATVAWDPDLVDHVPVGPISCGAQGLLIERSALVPRP